jgi:2-keto-4-pentenoate hydratase/2-oxohepta-3-ene-1,7-dioic acid hydratase in catechol pathway
LYKNTFKGDVRMHFITYEIDGLERIGVLNNSQLGIIPLSNILDIDESLTMLEFIKSFSEKYIEVINSSLNEKGIELKDVRLKAPIPEPMRNVICVGKNYKEHIKEVANVIDSEHDLPKEPIYFTKMVDRVVGPDEYINSHREITNAVDYEAELGVVIGKRGKNIPYEEVEDYIFGYTIINDVSVRDFQRRHTQWFKGKSFDETCPMGPYLVYKSEIPYPPELDIKCTVNGELRQDSNTKHFIFNISKLISNFSQGVTLKPGDIIATGTPAGVGMGFTPPKYLKQGDIVECCIEKIGTLRNVVD